MIASKLLKNPILMIGVLLMIIFIFDLRKKGIFFGREHLKPTFCKGAIIEFEKKAPKGWDIECRDNNLHVEVESVLKPGTKKENIKKEMYNELANNLMHLSKRTKQDSLGRTFQVLLKLESKTLDLVAITEGKYLAKMAMIQEPKNLLQHIQKTVQVKEISK